MTETVRVRVGAFVFPEYTVVVLKREALRYFRSDCPYCVRVRKMAAKVRCAIVVNTKTRDWVAIVPRWDA